MNQKQLVRILKSLANPRRMQILLFLRKHRSLNVSTIAEKLDLSFRSTSRHLQHLKDAGVIDHKQDSTSVFYSLSSEIPTEVIGLFARISL